MRTDPGKAIGSRARRWTSALLILCGAALLAWCGYFLADEYVAQWTAERAFESATHATGPIEVGQPPAASGPGRPAERAAAPGRGAIVARITVPRLKLSAIVLHGSDVRTLRRAPGHLENTAIPGEAGNAVIAGHRDTFFRPLERVRIGDDIYMETAAGRFHYRVAGTRVVKPQDVSVLDQTAEPVLTLITCFPFWVFGDAPDRFVVRAVGVADSTGPTFTPAVARLHEPVPTPPPPRDPAASQDPYRNGASASTDEGAVRQVVERFRIAYNSRLASHPETGAATLSFASCEVSINGDQATASCDGAAIRPSTDGEERGQRDFALERAATGWAIRSVIAR